SATTATAAASIGTSCSSRRPSTAAARSISTANCSAKTAASFRPTCRGYTRACNRRRTTTAAEIERARHVPTWAKWLAPALLLVAVAAAYSNSLHGEFIFDDHQSIPGNPSIRRLQPLSEVLFPPADITGDGGRTIDGRPALNLSLAVNYALHELDVRGYHLANLVLHALAALALYGVVRRTLLLPRWSEPLRHRATPLAFLCALLWALHPLQTESVT